MVEANDEVGGNGADDAKKIEYHAACGPPTILLEPTDITEKKWRYKISMAGFSCFSNLLYFNILLSAVNQSVNQSSQLAN